MENKPKVYKTDCFECGGEGVRWDDTNEFEEVDGEMLPPLCTICRGNGFLLVDEDNTILEEEMDKLDYY